MVLSILPVHASVIDRPFFEARALVVIIAATADENSGGVAPVAVDFNLLTPASSGSQSPDLIADDGFVFNSRNGFQPGQDFSGGASRLILEDEISGGRFRNRAGGDVDYLEPTDTLTAFGIDGATDINVRSARNVSRFLVASNTAFDVFAEVSDLETTGDFTTLGYSNIGFRLALNRRGGSGVNAWGSAAQNPAIGGSGIDTDLNDLGDLSTGPTKVFGGGRRTARFPGTLLEQAISFNVRYSLSETEDARQVNNYDFAMGSGTIGAEITYTIYTP